MVKENIIIDVKAEKIHGLTPIQEGMLFHRLLETDSSSYFLQSVIKVEGFFDFEIYKKAIQLLAEKHEVLRSLLAYRKVANPIMIIVQNRIPEVSYYDITQEADPYEWIQTYKENDNKRDFDFEQDTLFRSVVIKLADDRYQMMWSFHHIIVDGWSIALLIDDFKKYYKDLSEGVKEETLRAEILHFHSGTGTFDLHVKWIKSRNYLEGIEYWTNRLDDYNGNTQILPMRSENDRRIGEVNIRISVELHERLSAYARKCGVTMNTLVEAALGVLLQRYCGEDVVYGKVVSGRNSGIRNIENIVGLFINTIPQRITCDSETTFEELVHRIQADNLKSEQYDFCSLADIQSKTEKNSGLVKILYAFENYMSGEKNTVANVTFTTVEERQQTEYDLTFGAYEENVLCFCLEYNKACYSSADADRILNRLVKVLQILVTAPKSKISENCFLLHEEEEIVVHQFNMSELEVAKDKTIIALYEEQVKKTPDHVALVSGSKKLTYKEMDQKVNVLANKLRSMGVKPGDFVAIMAIRSMEMILGIYAILKSGAAYVPIDPTYPKERREFICQDCQPKALLLQGVSLTCDIPVINLEDSDIWIGDMSAPSAVNKQKDPVYVIYTSGTTGTPKGVVNRHGGLFHLLTWMEKEYPIDESDAILFKTTYIFDVSATEIFWWSIVGARLIILGDSEEKEPSAIIRAIHNQKVTVINFVPSMLSIFMSQAAKEDVEALRSLKYIIAAGEALNVQLSNHVYDVLSTDSGNRTLLANLYGPTEASIYATYYNCKAAEKWIPIGKPVGNVKLYILQGTNLCGIGVPGELHIAGEGLAKGYLNLDLLTKEKFMDNPFGPGKLYRTGDLARWMPDGNIDYLGRIDEQVKIRGFRIELGEIVSAIRNIDYISDCAVIVREDSALDKAIYAYLVADKPVSLPQVKEKISGMLPFYMIPTYMMQIDKIPVTRNGKLDRRALPVIEMQSEQEYVEPRNEMENLVCEVFKDILKVPRVGVNDNFFDMGGHSLKATRLMNRLETKTGFHVPLKRVFEAATPEKIAKLYGSSEEKENESIIRAEKKEWYPLTSMQKRIYLLNQYDHGGITYNMPQIYRMYGKVNIKKMKVAFEQLIQRHDILRTEFIVKEGQVYQKIRSKVECDFQYISDAKTDDDSIIGAFCRPFHLDQAPLIRLMIVKRSGYWLFLMDIHHIICDGISMGILMDELAELYNADKGLAEVRQYIDYSEWMQTRDLSAQKEFWLSEFADEVPVCNMPTDFARKQGQVFEGTEKSCYIDEELSKRIKKFTQKNDITEYMFFLSAVSILLSRYSYQEEIVVGSPVSNRVHVDTEKMVGMFVNTIALRMSLAPDETYMEYLEKIKQLCIKSYENQEFPFDELVNSVNIVRDLSRNPLFDVMYVYENMGEAPIEFSGFVMEEVKHDFHVAKFDFTFNISSIGNIYMIVLEYCTRLYSKETAEKMTEYFINLLKQLVTDPFRKIGTLEINSDADKELILNTFNDSHFTYDRRGTVVSEFEKMAEEYPNNTALIFEECHVTYGQLNEMANSLSHRLREMGVGREQKVALYCERSIEMIAGILGIMKSGGAYVPIDIQYPEDRTAYILKDASPAAVLTYHADVHTIIPKINLGDPTIWKLHTKNPERTILPTDLAYVIYTSGTTGKPKGVMLRHQGIVSMASYLKNMHDLTTDDCILQFANYVFDASVWEIMMALLNGAALAIVSEKTILSMDEFNKYVQKCGVTHALLPPNYYLQTDIRGLRTLTTGGSASNRKVVEKAISSCNYINAYGPTENTVLATYWQYADCKEKYECIPIGKPVGNTQVYIMDHDSLCGIGVPGELCIAGDGLARGYLNQEELTAEKFVDHPFGNGKLYRSGDLARWLPDGNIDFLGRMDKQVKIRGFRIELGEIENVIRNLEYITDVVIITRKNSDDIDYLCAYVVSESKIDTEQLKNEVSEKLPEYMIPAFVMQIDEIPVTKSGKVNVKELPAEGMFGNEYAAPRDKKEEIVCNVLADVLGLKTVGINDNFFEMGGDSITAIQVISRIRAMGMEVSVKDILSAKKPVLIAKHLKDIMVTYNQQEITGFIKPTMIQEAFLKNWNLTEPEYFNQAMVLKGSHIDTAAVKKAMVAVVNHHDILRAIVKEDQIYIRKPSEENSFDWYEIKADRKEDLEMQCEQVQKSFNLLEGPLVKLAYIQLHEEEYLMLCIHHLAVDTVSWDIIVEDFTQAYRQYKDGEEINLPLKSMSVAEWGNEVEQLKGSSMVLKHEQFWKAMLYECNEIRFIDSSIGDDTREDTFEDSMFCLDKEYTGRLLNEVNKKLGTKTSDILLAALTLAVCKHTGNRQVSIAFEEHGRNETGVKADISRTVGWFTNLYPVVLCIGNDEEETIIFTKERMNKVSKISFEYSFLRSKMELFDYMDADFSFNYLGSMDDSNKEETNKLFRKCDLEVGSSVSAKNILPGRYSIVFYISEKKMICSMSYNRKYYGIEFARSFMKIYKGTIESLIDYLSYEQETIQTLSDIEVDDISQEELEELNDFVDALF